MIFVCQYTFFRTLRAIRCLRNMFVHRLIVSVVTRTTSDRMDLIRPSEAAPMTTQVMLQVIYYRYKRKGMYEGLNYVNRRKRRNFCLVNHNGFYPWKNMYFTSQFLCRTSIFWTTVRRRAFFFIRRVVNCLTTMVQAVRDCSRGANRLFRWLTFRDRVNVRIGAFLVRTPYVLHAIVFRRLNVVRASNIVRTTFPYYHFRYAVNKAMFARAITIVIALIMPPFMVNRRLQVRFTSRYHVVNVNRCFICDPKCREEFTITYVIFNEVNMSTICGRTIQLLMIGRNTSIIFNGFEVRFYRNNERTPNIPNPRSCRMMYYVAQGGSFIRRSTAINAPITSGYGGYFRNSAIVLEFRVFTRGLNRVAFPTFFINFRPFLQVT